MPAFRTPCLQLNDGKSAICRGSCNQANLPGVYRF
jgi:hypothetical protein